MDPVGNNTWYYVHTLAVFYLTKSSSKAATWTSAPVAPGTPLVPVTSGGGFLGCLKGWFVNYITSGPITPGGVIVPGQTAIGIQLIN